jgi:hypothetical protein
LNAVNPLGNAARIDQLHCRTALPNSTCKNLGNFMQHWSRQRLQSVCILAGAVLAATAGTQPQAVSVPGTGSAAVEGALTTRVSFGSTNVMKPGSSVTFMDGLTVVLDKIDDSRCPPRLSCVWAGELAPQLTVHGGEDGAPQKLPLGTDSHNRKHAFAGYGFALIDASIGSATIVVTKGAMTTSGKP